MYVLNSHANKRMIMSCLSLSCTLMINVSKKHYVFPNCKSQSSPTHHTSNLILLTFVKTFLKMLLFSLKNS